MADGAGRGRWVYRHRRDAIDHLERQTSPGYFIALALGAAAGAWTRGSMNTLRDAAPALSHCIAGGLVGAIVAVELWKWRCGIRGSTCGPFVIPLCLGIVVGRFGRLLAGLFGLVSDLNSITMLPLPLLVGGMPFVLGFGLFKWGRALTREASDGQS